LYFTPESVFYFLHAQISLLEMPQRQRKKMMALTTNVMRDDSDKVKFINIYACDGIFLSVIFGKI